MSTPLPSFSIIIPTYNRPERIPECLTALLALNYPREKYDVIVVDDGSDHPLDDIVSRFTKYMEIRLLRQANAGPGAARNIGATQSEGDHLVFTDDDCHPEPDWLRAYANAITANPNALLGGDTLNGLPDNPWSTGSQAIQTWLYDYFDRVNANWRFFASNNICVPRHRYLELGGFDTETIHFASEDREFSERWVHHGGTLVHVPQARIAHLHHLTVSGFLRQHFAYGRGAFRLRLARERKAMPSPPRDQRWIREYLLGYPWRTPGIAGKLKLAATAVLSFAMTTIGYYYERLRSAK